MISILCINLKRRFDKRAAFLGAMFAQDVPDDVIAFFDAYDANEYQTRDDAYAHLKTEFPAAAVNPDWGAGTICVFLSYLKCLEKISGYPSDSRVILMMDHTVFGVRWSAIQALINSLDDFSVFQIQSIHAGVDLPKTIKAYNDDIDAEIVRNGVSCTVYTPWGAEMALDRFMSDLIFTIGEGTSQLLSYQPLVFSAKEPERWLRRHLNLSKWTGVVDSEREYANFYKGGENELAHFSIGSQKLRDVPTDRIGFKRAGWGTQE